MGSFATFEDFKRFGLGSKALANCGPADVMPHLVSQANVIRSYLRAAPRISLPLATPYPSEIVQANCVLAAFLFLQHSRGFRPAQYDDGFLVTFNATRDWLKMVARGDVLLDSAYDTTPSVVEGRRGGARVSAQTPRGWTD